MQKSFFAIALALTLTSAFAAYNTSNYTIAPILVAADSDTSFTNQSSLFLASITSGNIYVVSGNLTVNPNNLSNSNWNLFYRQLNTTTLSTTQNNSVSIVAPASVFFLNNYAIGFGVDSTNGASNLYVYQTPLTNGTNPGRIQLSNNNNASFTLVVVGFAQIGNTTYVAYLAANNTANITSFTFNSSAPGTPFTLSTTFDTPNSLSLTWGGALSSSQLFAVWIENGYLKDAVIDVSKGAVNNLTVIPGYNSSYQFTAFATDGKFYGEFGYGRDPNNFNYTLYWVRTTANGTLIQIANYTSNTSTFASFIPYGQYIAVFFADSTAASGINYAYEIWTLDTFNTTSVQPRKQYLSIDSNSTQVPFRIVSGGVYTLLYNNRLQPNGTLSNIQVGLLLPNLASANGSNNSNNTKQGSYLASVLSFLLTIVAGLLLL